MAEGGERTRQEGFGEGEGGSKGGAELRTRRRGNRRSRTGEGEPVNIHDGGTILKICRGIYVNIWIAIPFRELYVNNWIEIIVRDPIQRVFV
uniref:Uncharacterized protein n=1 Tax=Setaria viridis TaxID=4556 RepID=A0A4U6W751_SETVI|nr:hypothetical protein SEVIR_1G102501v2 [Setaria viridis]